MTSTILTDFHLFPQLPPELREMVWEEAMPGPLGMQRFNAEIANHPTPYSGRPDDLVLCLTPHEDFVQLTTAHHGLLGACRESRWTANARIKSYLPIDYTASDANGSLAARSARVPFNPGGRVCISRLGAAVEAAAAGHTLRGARLQGSHGTSDIAKYTHCVTLLRIEHLTISLDGPEDLWCLRLVVGSDLIARNMDELETVALLDEMALNKMHLITEGDVQRLHSIASLTPEHADVQRHPAVLIPWEELYDKFVSGSRAFDRLVEFRAQQGPLRLGDS